MKKSFRILMTGLLCLAMLWGGVRFTQAVTYTKPDYRKQHWDITLNAFITAVQTDVTTLYNYYGSLANLVNNWAVEDNILIMVTATPTYVSNSQFTLPSNYITRFPSGAVIWAELSGSLVSTTVSSSSYSAPNTTVNLSTGVLTNPITRIYVVATRDGLWPFGPGYLVSADYDGGAPTVATLGAADTVAAAAGKELRVTSSYTIGSDLTLTAPKVTVAPGAVLTQAAGSTHLTINGQFEGSNGCFSDNTATGDWVVFGSKSNGVVKASWWGAVGDNSTDNAAFLNAACGSIKASAHRMALVIDPGLYKVSVPINLNDYVYIRGFGQGTVIIPIGNYPAFVTIEDVGSQGTTTLNYRDLISDLEIDASANTNDIDLIYSEYTINGCVIRNINFNGNPSQEQCGVHFYHTKPNGDPTRSYSNLLTTSNFSQLYSRTRGMICLEGSASATRKLNNNVILANRLTGFHVGMWICGDNNRIAKNNFNSCADGVKLDGSGGRDWRIVFMDSYNTELSGNYFDESANDVLIKCSQTNIASQPSSFICGAPNYGLNSPLQVADLKTAYDSDHSYAATYASATSFTVAADVTSSNFFQAGRRLWLDCGVDGWRPAISAGAIYSAPNTTVTVTTSVVTSNLVYASRTELYNEFRPQLLTSYSMGVYRKLQSYELRVGAEGRNSVEQGFFKTTTAGTVTEVWNRPVSEGEFVSVEFTVVGRDRAGVEKACYKGIGFVYRNSGGDVTLIDSTLLYSSETSAGLDAAVAINLAGTPPAETVRILVTGKAATTIDWVGTVKTITSTSYGIGTY